MNAILEKVATHAKHFPYAKGGGVNAVVVFPGGDATVDKKTGRREKLGLNTPPQIEFYADRPGGSPHGDFISRYDIDGLAGVAKNLSSKAVMMEGVDGILLAEILQWAQKQRIEFAKKHIDDAGKRTAKP